MKLRASTVASRDPDRAVEVGLDAFFRAFEDSRVARVCWLEVLGVSARIDALYTSRIQRFAELLLSLAAEVLPRSRLVGAEPRVIAIALNGAISEAALFWLLSDYAEDRKVLVSATAQVLRGTTRSLSATRTRKGSKRRTTAPARSKK